MYYVYFERFIWDTDDWPFVKLSDVKTSEKVSNIFEHLKENKKKTERIYMKNDVERYEQLVKYIKTWENIEKNWMKYTKN